MVECLVRVMQQAMMDDEFSRLLKRGLTRRQWYDAFVRIRIPPAELMKLSLQQLDPMGGFAYPFEGNQAGMRIWDKNMCTLNTVRQVKMEEKGWMANF